MTASLIVFVIIRIIMALFEGNRISDANRVNITVTDTGDGFHPAEFELRDHFTMRCSD